jgi:hypothetical protein
MNQEIKSIRLLYEDPTTGMVCVVHPSGESPLEYIVKHAIPKDCPYWVVEDTVIPEDRSFSDDWELDVDSLGNPNGVGEGEL